MAPAPGPFDPIRCMIMTAFGGLSVSCNFFGARQQRPKLSLALP